jgi:hypothetical protein
MKRDQRIPRGELDEASADSIRNTEIKKGIKALAKKRVTKFELNAPDVAQYAISEINVACTNAKTQLSREPADDNASNHMPGEHEPAVASSVGRREGSRPKNEIDQRHVWITAPLMIAFLGLLGTGIGALTQQYSNTLLERNKFEYTLIQKALAAPRPEALKELIFFSKIGLLSGLAEGKIADASGDDGKELPIFHGAALRDNIISVQQAKSVLKYLTVQQNLKDPKNPGFYDGPIDDKFDLNFQIAIMRFQREANLQIDGLIGPKTVLSLWEACPVCPDLLQKNERPDNPAK